MASQQKSVVNVVFGAMTFGNEGTSHVRVTDLKTAGSILDTFQKHGHKEVDTSRVYGDGTSETMLAELDWQKRGLVVETKFYPIVGANVTPERGPPQPHTLEGLRENLLKSLKALKVDKLDLWYLHGPDRTTPYEVTMKAVNELHQEGYFERFGISNYMSWEVAQICELCRAKGWKQPDVYQGIYNGLHRAVEAELLRCLRHYGVAFYAFNPLAGGYLTARYHREEKDNAIEAGSRFDPSQRQGRQYRQRYWHDAYFDALDLLRPVAKQHGLTEAECALRWMTHHSTLKREHGDAIIIGASSVEHIEQNLLDLEKGPLPDDVLHALDKGWEGVRGLSFKYWH